MQSFRPEDMPADHEADVKLAIRYWLEGWRRYFETARSC